jgi:hypothetical protein
MLAALADCGIVLEPLELGSVSFRGIRREVYGRNSEFIDQWSR